jgi:hypothetical protein
MVTPQAEAYFLSVSDHLGSVSFAGLLVSRRLATIDFNIEDVRLSNRQSDRRVILVPSGDQSG